MTKKWIILCFAIGICVLTKAQVSLNTVVQKHNDFKTALPGVRLHFVFNQEKYAAGDTVFFKAYFLKEDLKPVEGKQLIDLSLVAPGGKVLQHFLFTVVNGIGENQVVLPIYLAPGIYNLAAYSSWMKNIESAKVFSNDLIVVGETTIKKQKTADTLPVHVAVLPSDIRITSTNGSLTRYQQLYMLVINKGRIIYSRSFLQGTRDIVSLNSTTLLPGVNVIHIIDKLGRELGTATHYLPDTDTVTATITSRSPTVITRRRVAVTVTVHDKDNRPVEGEFALKVYNGTFLDSTQYSFERMLAASTPTYEPWHQIIYGNTKQHYNFTTSLAKRGTVYYQDGVTPVPAHTRLFFYLQENDVMIQSTTVAGGKIRLTVPEIRGNDLLFYMAEREGNELPGVKIIWETATLPVPAPPASVESAEADMYGIFAANKKVIDEAFNFREEGPLDVKNAAVRKESDLESRLKGADISVRVDKFVAFATMEDLVHEIIPALNFSKSKGRIRVQVSLQKGLAESEPLYIIDGIATKDTKYFMSLKPVDIDVVKLVTNPGKLVALGLMGRSGVVIVETKAGNARPPEDPSTVINGINWPLAFRPSLSTDKDRPTFRSTIFWNPGIKTDPAGKAIVEFDCSDDLGPLKVRVDGITTDGRPFSGEITLNSVLAEK